MRDSRTALWSDWGTDPFTRALAARRPVLLFVTAPWVAAGRAMEATTWRDADLRRWLDDAVVALRVDADWRPDIADRYAPEGLPTTALLSPIGEPLSSTTYVSAEALRSAIERVSATLRARFREFLTPAPATVTPPAADPAELRSLADRVEAAVVAAIDPEEGGFGEAPKFLQADACLLMLSAVSEARGTATAAVVERTLRALREGGLRDPRTAAYFRACRTRTWSDADPALLVDVNAAALDFWVQAWRTLKLDSLVEPIRALVAWLERAETPREGADPSGYRDAWYEDGRLAWGGVVQTAASADACRALMRAGAAMDEPKWIERAIGVLDRLVALVYQRKAGVAHVFDGQAHVRGLLVDQVAVSEALVEGAVVSGRIAYQDLAEELMRSAMRRLWDRRGGFRDRVASAPGGGDIGLLGRPLWPVAINCRAARVLVHLARLSGDRALLRVASETLAAIAPLALEEGVAGAAFSLAVHELQAERVD